MRTARRILVLLACALPFAASGGADGSTSREGVLAGLVKTRDFVVPRGTTRVIRHDLKVVASHDITIAGTLRVPPGVDVSMRAAHVFLFARSGRLVAAPPKRTHGVDGQPVVSATESEVTLLGSERIEVDADLDAPPGAFVKVASAEFGSVVVRGRIKTTNGNDAVSEGQDGQNAGSISLGGFFGPNKTLDVDGATLVAGAGGAGYTPISAEGRRGENACRDNGGGSDGRAYLLVHASDGGQGGSIRLMAREITAAGATITAGRGGHGGDASVGRTRTPEGSGGTDVVAWAGTGGEGGSAVVEGEYTGPTIYAGGGGSAGDVRAAAGDGAPGTPGCDGGRTKAVLGKPGYQGLNKGKGTKKPRFGGQGSEVLLSRGGGGGESPSRAGNGGEVTLEVPGPTTKRDPSPNFGGYYFRSIELEDYAKGGRGLNGCTAAAREGGDGGRGGRLASPKRVRYLVRHSFRGGDGGRGIPPGDGGPAGTAKNKPEQRGDSFLPGDDGSPCPETGPYRYSFGGSSAPALHVSYTVVKTTGNTDAGTFDVLSGTACGDDPLRASWTVKQRSSKSGDATLNVHFDSFNPYPLYIGSYDNAGNIAVNLRLTQGKAAMVGLEVNAPPAFRDIVKSPAEAPITKMRVDRCP